MMVDFDCPISLDSLINYNNNYRCNGNYYGSQCDIDGEVLAVAIGASVSAILIIGLTLVCLCMWRYVNKTVLVI